jgi:hypothetical protein
VSRVESLVTKAQGIYLHVEPSCTRASDPVKSISLSYTRVFDCLLLSFIATHADGMII